MANKKISELTEATVLNTSDIIPIVQNGETKKVEYGIIKNYVDNKFTNNINETGKAPLSETVKNYVDGKHKEDVLWQGSQTITSSTNLTLSHNVYDYKEIVIVGQWGNVFTIPIVSGETYCYGGTNYIDGNNRMTTSGFKAEITNSGNTINAQYFAQLKHQASSNHTTLETPQLLKIIGRL